MAAEIHTWRDTNHDGAQWIAEVVEHHGHEEELIFYSTTWHLTQADAVWEADNWCRQNSIADIKRK